MKRLVAFTILIALAGCGGPAVDQAEEAVTPATSYAFDKDDLLRSVPSDICRQLDSDFALKIMGRVDAALPLDSKGSAQLDQFTVQDRFDGKGKEAVLWFNARNAGKDRVVMFAIAPFEPKGCKLGEMSASIGTDLYRDAGKSGFKIP